MSDEAMSARDPGEAAEPVPTAGEAADEAARPLGSGGALVPLSSAAGRALVAVIAIMTFLAALTAGAAQLVASASSGWRAQISREATIQVRPAAGRALDAEVEAAAAAARATPGVAGVRV